MLLRASRRLASRRVASRSWPRGGTAGLEEAGLEEAGPEAGLEETGLGEAGFEEAGQPVGRANTPNTHNTPNTEHWGYVANTHNTTRKLVGLTRHAEHGPRQAPTRGTRNTEHATMQHDTLKINTTRRPTNTDRMTRGTPVLTPAPQSPNPRSNDALRDATP